MALERYRAGNAVFAAATDIICLFAHVTATGNYDTFKNAGGAYTITAGKNFYIVRAAALSGTANVGGEIGQSTASVANSTIPAGWVALTHPMYLVNPSAYVVVKEEGILVPVARATGQFITYHGTQAAGAGGAMIWGFEI